MEHRNSDASETQQSETSQDGTFEQALQRLEAEVPPAAARLLRRLSEPNATYIRLPVAILCIAGGFLWFLPLLGIWMMPLGLLLLAFDIRILRRPVAALTIWILDRWVAVRAWTAAKFGSAMRRDAGGEP